MRNTVYADHAATTPLDPAALEAMLPYLTHDYGNPSALYAAAQSPKEALEQARRTVAACIGATAEEIHFTSGGTEANNWAIKGTVAAAAAPATIVTTAVEHRSVLAPCAALERQGHTVVTLAPDGEGRVTAAALEQQLTRPVQLVSVMLANNELGTLQPVSRLAETAHSHGALFHTDGVACVGHLPVDVTALGVDLLSASAHKFGGPKGIGFLYIKQGTPILPLLDGGGQEHGLRAGTENVAAAVGLATALQNSVAALEHRRAHLCRLTHRFLAGLAAAGIPYVRHGAGETLPGLLSLAFPDADAETLLHRLDLMGIAVSTGAACNGHATATSHVLQAIGLNPSEAAATLRFSFGHQNTEAEADAIVAALGEILPR